MRSTYIRIILRMRAYYMYGTTAKFKSANIFISAAWDQTTKFKDCQYFRLYGIPILETQMHGVAGEGRVVGV